MFVMNRGHNNVTIQKYASYSRVTLGPNAGFRIEGSPQEIRYYNLLRSLGISIVPDAVYLEKHGVLTPKQKVESEEQTKVTQKEQTADDDLKGLLTGEEAKVEVVDETKVEVTENAKVEIETVDDDKVEVIEEPKEYAVDCEDLRPDAVYTFDFLTAKKAVTILTARNVEFDEKKLTTKELKNLVLETNPKQ